MKTTWLPASGLRADHARGQHGHFGVRFAEAQQRGQAVGFGGAALEFGVAHFQAVQFGVHGVVLFLRAAQGDVVAPAVLGAVRSIQAATRRSGETSSTAQTRIRRTCCLALDLHGQQQHLRDDDAASSVRERCREGIASMATVSISVQTSGSRSCRDRRYLSRSKPDATGGNRSAFFRCPAPPTPADRRRWRPASRFLRGCACPDS